MPPAGETRRPTPEEIERLRRWIDQGAAWQPHWSFIPPRRPAAPAVRGTAWVRHPIDAFILRRLEDEGLAPSPEADRARLIRRVTLDLTGLPPTPEDVDAFLADTSSGAYDRVVDRLLASPRYGEHMARYWLDAARYGDTHGLHLDNRRSMWRWRDWVIEAYNRNLPFDVFTTEQLAGDLLPDPTLDQRIATGFNRNNVTTSEGGAIDAEYLVKYAVDRVETTSTVWMGRTAGCAACHDHKFDPISQREFYELFAFFNNVAERAMDGNRHDPPPVVRAPTPEQAARLEEIRAEVTALERRLDAPMPAVDEQQSAWEAAWRERSVTRWEVLDPIESVSTRGATLRELEDHSLLAEGENPDRDAYEIVARTDATGLRIVRLEALTHETLPHTGPGRADNANFVLSEIEVEAVSVADPGRRRVLALVSATADHEQMNGPYLAEHARDGIVDDTNGWAIEGFNRREDRTVMFASDEPFGFAGGTELRIRLRFETHFARHAIGRARLSVSADAELHRVLAPSDLGPWHVVGPFPANDGTVAYDLPFGPEHDLDAIDLDATYQDGGLAWRAAPEFADGAVHTLEGERAATYLHRTIDAPSARSMELSLGSDDAIKVWVNGRLVLGKNTRRPVAPDQEKIVVPLAAGPNRVLMKIVNESGGYGFYFRPVGEGADRDFLDVLAMLVEDGPALDDDQRIRLRRYYRRHHSPELKAVYEALRDRQEDEEAFVRTLPITLVMAEREERRDAFVLRRGNYDQPTDPVSPGVPGVLPPLPGDRPADRLALARWLVSGSHPLTARVAVNRYWQRFFGNGIVRTSEDFGAQGEWPSHPDLLDWLATEFVASGWDVKAMQRLIVTSATYRQSSRTTPGLIARDPENRRLARGPRFRMDAEMIRDQALAASGLLVGTIGGASVKPYQPAGLWKDVAYPDSDTQTFEPDTGDALYRRSMYTFWKRTSPPPNLQSFDAPSRETCTIRRPRTNTPLQALVLLNDPQFVEAARALARCVMREAPGDPAAQVSRAFRRVTARRPDARETAVLVDAYRAQLAIYRADAAAAEALLGVGGAPRDVTVDAGALAALANVAGIILSLDEAVTKP
jgi:hypothetical protein